MKVHRSEPIAFCGECLPFTVVLVDGKCPACKFNVLESTTIVITYEMLDWLSCQAEPDFTRIEFSTGGNALIGAD